MKEVMVHAGKTNVWFILNERQEGGLKAKVPMPSYLYNSYPPPPPQKKKEKKKPKIKKIKSLKSWVEFDGRFDRYEIELFSV